MYSILKTTEEVGAPVVPDARRRHLQTVRHGDETRGLLALEREWKGRWYNVKGKSKVKKGEGIRRLSRVVCAHLSKLVLEKYRSTYSSEYKQDVWYRTVQ